MRVGSLASRTQALVMSPCVKGVPLMVTSYPRHETAEKLPDLKWTVTDHPALSSWIVFSTCEKVGYLRKSKAVRLLMVSE